MFKQPMQNETSVWTECTVDNGTIIGDTNSYWKQNEHSSDFLLTTNKTLQLIMDSTSLFINAYLINNTASLSTPSFSSTKQPYINLPTFIYIYSSSTNYSYSYSNTFLPSHVHFVLVLSDQIANDIIHIFVQASLPTSTNNLKLVVLENMLNKHFKQSLISQIKSMLLAFLTCDYTTYESIIRSCIVHFRLWLICNRYLYTWCTYS